MVSKKQRTSVLLNLVPKNEFTLFIILFLARVSPKRIEHENGSLAQAGLKSFKPVGKATPITHIAYAIDIPISDLKLTVQIFNENEKQNPDTRNLTLNFSFNRILFVGFNFELQQDYEDFLSLLSVLGGETSFPYYITKTQMEKISDFLSKLDITIKNMRINIPDGHTTIGSGENVILFKIKLENSGKDSFYLFIEVSIDKKFQITNARMIKLEVNFDGLERIQGPLSLDEVFTNKKSVKNFIAGADSYSDQYIYIEDQSKEKYDNKDEVRKQKLKKLTKGKLLINN